MDKNLVNLYKKQKFEKLLLLLNAKLRTKKISRKARIRIYMMISDIYYAKKDYLKSRDALRKALRYKDDISFKTLMTAYVNLGITYLDLGQEYHAFKNFMKCLRLCPWHPIANRLIGEIFIVREDEHFAMYFLVSAARHRYCRRRSLNLIKNCLENNGHFKLAASIQELIDNLHLPWKLKSERMNRKRWEQKWKAKKAKLA